MTRSLWLDSSSGRSHEELDVAIIGGGIIGAGAAYWLSRRQGLKVALMEGTRLAGGATGRGAGFVLRGVRPYYNQAVKTYGREPAKYLLGFAEESQALLRDLVQRHGNSFELIACGSYLLACSLEELQDLHESAELMREDGFDCEYQKEDPLGRDFYGALFNPGDCGINPAKLVRALAEASGFSVHEDEPVSRIELDDRKRLVVTTPRRLLTCARVLVTTNAYSPLLEPSFEGKVEPARLQILVTQPLRKSILERLCCANYGWEYFRQLPDKRLLLGGCRELFCQQEVGYADIVTQPVQIALEHYLKQRFPDVAGVPIDYRWSGVAGYTNDGLPLVGELSQLPGVYFAVGCNGHGLGYGLNMSRLLTEVALDGKSAGQFAANRAGLEAEVAAAAAKDRVP